LLPAPDGGFGFGGAALDLHRADPVGTQQHNPRPPDMLLWAIPGRDDGLKPLPISQAKANFDAGPHPGSFA
jgi:hypothetical protein